MNKQQITNWIKLSGVVGVMTLVMIGFSSERSIISTCTSIVERSVVAGFSERTFDYLEGEWGTDYWDEPASEVVRVIAENEVITYPEYPAHDTEMKNTPHFDKFRHVTKASLYIGTLKEGEFKEYSKNIIHASDCIDRLGLSIRVKKWYAFSYGTEL